MQTRPLSESIITALEARVDFWMSRKGTVGHVTGTCMDLNEFVNLMDRSYSLKQGDRNVVVDTKLKSCTFKAGSNSIFIKHLSFTWEKRND